MELTIPKKFYLFHLRSSSVSLPKGKKFKNLRFFVFVKQYAFASLNFVSVGSRRNNAILSYPNIFKNKVTKEIVRSVMSRFLIRHLYVREKDVQSFKIFRWKSELNSFNLFGKTYKFIVKFRHWLILNLIHINLNNQKQNPVMKLKLRNIQKYK